MQLAEVQKGAERMLGQGALHAGTMHMPAEQQWRINPMPCSGGVERSVLLWQPKGNVNRKVCVRLHMPWLAGCR